MSIIVGIDVGGSTTKIVGFDGNKLLAPILVKATDPIASVYGGFGKFTSDNKISLSGIEKVMVTGVGSAFLGDNIYGIETFDTQAYPLNRLIGGKNHVFGSQYSDHYHWGEDAMFAIGRGVGEKLYNSDLLK